MHVIYVLSVAFNKIQLDQKQNTKQKLEIKTVNIKEK